jgi:hypothetical protein
MVLRKLGSGLNFTCFVNRPLVNGADRADLDPRGHRWDRGVPGGAGDPLDRRD